MNLEIEKQQVIWMNDISCTEIPNRCECKKSSRLFASTCVQRLLANNKPRGIFLLKLNKLYGQKRGTHVGNCLLKVNRKTCNKSTFKMKILFEGVV